MPDCNLTLAKQFAVGILILILVQAAPTAQAYETGKADRSFPLGFGYCPQPVSGTADVTPQISNGQQSQIWLPIDISGDAQANTRPAAMLLAGGLPDAVSSRNVQDAFPSPPTLERVDDPPASGNLRLLSLFDTGQGVLGSPAKADFTGDPIQDQSQQPPEALAMFLLGTGLIGFARIQRRQFKN